jgi:hypothetical protein
MWLARCFLNSLSDLVNVVEVVHDRCLFHAAKPEMLYPETKAHEST